MWHFMSFGRLMISALLSRDKKCSDINLKLQIMRNKILFRMEDRRPWTGHMHYWIFTDRHWFCLPMASVTKVQFHNPGPGFLGLCSRLNIIKYYNMLLKKNPKWGQLVPDRLHSKERPRGVMYLGNFYYTFGSLPLFHCDIGIYCTVYHIHTVWLHSHW